MGSEADWAQLDPDFAAGKKALVSEDWNSAITALTLAVMRDPRNADIHNYIGYAYRRLRQFGPAMQYYQQALVLNRLRRQGERAAGVGAEVSSGLCRATLLLGYDVPCPPRYSSRHLGWRGGTKNLSQ